MKKILIGGVCFASLMLKLCASGLLDESFDGYTAGNLVSQGGWTQVGSTATSPIQVNAGVVSMAQGSAQDADRDLSASVTSGSIYYTATINFSAKNGTGDYALALTDGGTSAFGARIYAKSSGAGFALAWAGSSTAPAVYGAELSFNTSYKIVVRYDIIAGATNDVGKLYVTSGTFNSAEINNAVYQDVATWTGGTEVTSFAALLLRQGTNSGTFTVDAIKVGTTFSDVVSAVPEPGAYGVIAGIVVLVGVLVRRRQGESA